MANSSRDNRRSDAPLRPRQFRRFTKKMQAKLLSLFFVMLILFAFLFSNIIRINRDKGDSYTRQVLVQQSYDNSTIPFRRGSITDCKGTTLASSTRVYNVIIDCKALTRDSAYLSPTMEALSQAFGLETSEISEYVKKHTDNQYYVIAKNVSYTAKEKFDTLADANADINGVWFESRYMRTYPNGSLASDVIGFASTSNQGSYGLEEYYNSTLNGTPGRSYGYISDATDVEKTTIAAIDGNNLVLTLDANIQSIVEKYVEKFNTEHTNNVRTGNGARNIGCIVMDCNTGGILAMASSPGYDLNDPYDTSALVGMSKLDLENNDQPLANEYLTQEDVDNLTDEEQSVYLNALWKNFCISDYYEPGSTAKPFTVAAGLETASFSPTQTYYCDGSLTVAEDTEPIKCHNTYGDGTLTVGEAVERSCNVALMQMALSEGKAIFTKYQNIFGFGLKTNIDLANEARTDSLVYTADTMRITDLATNSFGQNFDVTMIEMISGFCSLINGGNYYQPYLVSKITSPSGATVKNIEPRVIKKTVSEETSEWIRSYCQQVVTGENGTGKTARPAGYIIGGKTGTAETLPRSNGQYVVSFMGYAPADDPQIAIYVVVDRPNAYPQDDAKYATGIVRNCLTEILPYLNIPMTEELSDAEKQELEELQASGAIALGAEAYVVHADEEETSGSSSESGDSAEQTQSVQNNTQSDASVTVPAENTAQEAESTQTAEAVQETTVDESWKNFPLDEESGYLVNPDTGHYVDPESGHEYDVGPADLEEIAADEGEE